MTTADFDNGIKGLIELAKVSTYETYLSKPCCHTADFIESLKLLEVPGRLLYEVALRFIGKYA